MFNKRHLTIERLEVREMKAGDITAVLQNGSLFLTEAAGQAGKNNAVTISELSNGMVRVAGNAIADGTVSKVNGLAYQDFRVAGSLNVNLGAGNDLLVIGGEGDPAATPTFTSVNIDVSAPQPVNLPATGATAATKGTTAMVVAPPTVPALPDDDNVNIWGINVTGSMSITTGVGSDNVFVSGANVGTSGSGNLSINTGIGADTVESTGQIAGTITVQMNGLPTDVDHVTFNGVYAQGNVQIITGAGNDFVNVLTTSTNATVIIQTGAGNDTVALLNIHAVDKLMASLGDGNDSLSVDYVYSNRFDFEGGAGTNSLTITKNLEGATMPGAYTLSEIGWTYINGRYYPPPTSGHA
jgi:hypothetical protein